MLQPIKTTISFQYFDIILKVNVTKIIRHYFENNLKFKMELAVHTHNYQAQLC